MVLTLAADFGLAMSELLDQTPYELALWNATAGEYSAAQRRQTRHARS